jgi:hypothetical protein
MWQRGAYCLDILSSNEGCVLMFAKASGTVVETRIWRRRVEKGVAGRSVRSARMVRVQVRKGKAGRRLPSMMHPVFRAQTPYRRGRAVLFAISI